MTLFNIPIAPTSIRPISHIPGSTQNNKKRKAAVLEDEDELRESRSPSSGLDPAITNPLSLTPNEVAQYRTAGLRLDEQLPPVQDWPHRPLPRGKSNLQTTVEKEKSKTEPHLRVHHIGVLTTVLHRCLNQGDIPRASKAWALLLRTQIDGKAVDIRTSGYWCKGAELLVRSGEKLVRRRTTRDGYDTSDEESQNEADSDDEVIEEDVERRWGTVIGLEQAKDYYERLILQYPYKRQFHDTVTALDFYPAMFGCEIYGVQFTQQEALRNLDASGDMSQDREDDVDSDDGGILSWEEMRIRRKHERDWNRREEIRRSTLQAAEIIAIRMDALMAGPPYSDSHILQRLRGNLALYVGDLNVPTSFGDEEDEEDDGNDASRSGRFERQVQRQRSLDLQREERERAGKCFAKIRQGGGRVEEGFDTSSIEVNE